MATLLSPANSHSHKSNSPVTTTYHFSPKAIPTSVQSPRSGY